MRTDVDLRMLQALPLDLKIPMSMRRLRDWINYYGVEGVYLGWSGGKDSTVVRHMIQQKWPDLPSVFSNTGLEYPEIQQFVRAAKKRGEPVEIRRPSMSFADVIKQHGYPIISKEVSEKVRKARQNIKDGKYSLRLCQLGVMPDEYGGLEVDERYDYFGTAKGSKFTATKYRPLLDVDFLISEECCWEMKKSVMLDYERETGRVPILGMLAAESKMRQQGWMKTGCNAFESDRPQSNPIAFWTNQDVLMYIHRYKVEIPSVYGEVVYAEQPEQIRFEEIVADYYSGCEKLCTTGCDRTGCIFCGFGAHLEKGIGRFERLKFTHPHQYEFCIYGGEYNEDGLWQPNKQGLGMGHVFDTLNRIYGDGFIKY